MILTYVLILCPDVYERLNTIQYGIDKREKEEKEHEFRKMKEEEEHEFGV